MDSNDWTIYNGLMPAIEYDPVTQHIVFNAALLQLFNLPSSTSLPQFLEVITPLLWQQVCQLKHGQSKLIACLPRLSSLAVGCFGQQYTIPM